MGRRPLLGESRLYGSAASPRRVGAVAGVGLVAVGGSSDYEILGLEPFVVVAADSGEIADVGPATVAVPFLDVVEFASVHGGTALEASAVSDGDCEALGNVAQSLVSTQPEGTAPPVEDHAGQLGVGGEGLEDLAGYGADSDDLDLSVGVGAVHYAYGGGEDELGGGFGLDPDGFVMNSPVKALRLVSSSKTTSARRCFGVRTSSGFWPVVLSWRRWCM